MARNSAPATLPNWEKKLLRINRHIPAPFIGVPLFYCTVWLYIRLTHRFLGALTTGNLLMFYIYLILGLALGLLSITTWVSYVSLSTQFLPENKPKEIPNGASKEVDSLRAEAKKLEFFGFRELSLSFLNQRYKAFILNSISQDRSCILSHLNVANRAFVSEIRTEFTSGVNLLTSTSGHGFNRRESTTHYTQLFPGVSYEELLNKHQQAITVFRERGHQPLEWPDEDPTQYLYDLDLEVLTGIRKEFLWPIRSGFRMLRKAGKQYKRPIESQLDQGIIKIHRHEA